MAGHLDIALLVPPGLESVLREEAVQKGFLHPKIEPGAVCFKGRWLDVWRANLHLRGASRVLIRIATFHASHLSQLDKIARQIDWLNWIPERAGIKVEVTCRKSKIYHSGAAAQRIRDAAIGATGGRADPDGRVYLIARIDKDQCTISLDTSGDLLHKRGFKQAVGKAPLRETMASMFLQACGFKGDQPVIDPMCGSGTVVIEAAEAAARLAPGRGRSFSFQIFPSFDIEEWTSLLEKAEERVVKPEHQFLGADRNAAAVKSSIENAQRSGVEAFTSFVQEPFSALQRPDGPPGLVFVNPPYGTRIGERQQLNALHGSLGATLKKNFAGWRIGMITTEASFASAMKLPFEPAGPPVPHGSLRVRLYQTKPL